MKKTPFMGTTEIDSKRTAGEISTLLVEHGARHIALEYDEAGKVTAMSFVLIVSGVPHPFKLPARIEAMQAFFKRRRIETMKWRAHEFEAKDREQAERVAWRQLLRWCEAQFALIETGMVKKEEVFSPYLLNEDGRTLFECLEESRFKALPPGKQA